MNCANNFGDNFIVRFLLFEKDCVRASACANWDQFMRACVSESLTFYSRKKRSNKLIGRWTVRANTLMSNDGFASQMCRKSGLPHLILGIHRELYWFNYYSLINSCMQLIYTPEDDCDALLCFVLNHSDVGLASRMFTVLSSPGRLMITTIVVPASNI